MAVAPDSSASQRCKYRTLFEISALRIAISHYGARNGARNGARIALKSMRDQFQNAQSGQTAFINPIMSFPGMAMSQYVPNPLNRSGHIAANHKAAKQSLSRLITSL
jgi:hypothetical protein